MSIVLLNLDAPQDMVFRNEEEKGPERRCTRQERRQGTPSKVDVRAAPRLRAESNSSQMGEGTRKKASAGVGGHRSQSATFAGSLFDIYSILN
jgi:hypothetical protein